MISRLSAFASTFAVAAATALVFTAQAHAPALAAPVAAKTIRVVELPHVVVVARRQDRPAP